MNVAAQEQSNVHNVSLFCADLNECESNPCSQECANVYGSYQCYCRRGYQLSDVDGMTCEGKLEQVV